MMSIRWIGRTSWEGLMARRVFRACGVILMVALGSVNSGAQPLEEEAGQPEEPGRLRGCRRFAVPGIRQRGFGSGHRSKTPHPAKNRFGATQRALAFGIFIPGSGIFPEPAFPG